MAGEEAWAVVRAVVAVAASAADGVGQAGVVVLWAEEREVG